MTHCLICKTELTEPEMFGVPHIPLCQRCWLICGDNTADLFEWFNEWEIEDVMDYQLQFYDIEDMDGGIEDLLNELDMDEISADMIVVRE
jgi:hypothetical protein